MSRATASQVPGTTSGTTINTAQIEAGWRTHNPQTCMGQQAGSSCALLAADRGPSPHALPSCPGQGWVPSRVVPSGPDMASSRRQAPPHCQHTDAPLLCEGRHGCWPPRGECDIPFKQASPSWDNFKHEKVPKSKASCCNFTPTPQVRGQEGPGFGGRGLQRLKIPCLEEQVQAAPWLPRTRHLTKSGVPVYAPQSPGPSRRHSNPGVG